MTTPAAHYIHLLCFPLHHWLWGQFTSWCPPLVEPNQYMSLDSAYFKKKYWEISIKFKISCFSWNFASYDTSGPEFPQGYNRLEFSIWWSLPWSAGSPVCHWCHLAASLLHGDIWIWIIFLSTGVKSARFHLNMPFPLLLEDYSRIGKC